MSDISVDVLLGTLKNLTLSSKVHEKQLRSFVEEIEYLRGFLEITEKKCNEHPQIILDLMMQIRNVVCKAECSVEQYAALVFKVNDSPLERHVHVSLDLESLRNEIKTLKAEVEHILGENMHDIIGVAGEKLKHPSTGSEGGLNSSSERNTYKVGEEEVVVGFEDEVNALLGKLSDSVNGQLEIISIIGAGGGGKTTLAKEVYDHPSTLHMFDIRAWVNNVSQDYNKVKKTDRISFWNMRRDMFIRILVSILEYHEECRICGPDELKDILFDCLKGKKYLIVMDDIWDLEAWNDIQESYPKECKGSKVLFTSRQPVEPADIHCVCHNLNLLSTSCSWELLQKKVFKGKECPQNLVDIGMQIAEKCKGLPLAIITIAGILANKDETDNLWEEVAKHLSSIIATNNEGYMEMIELSYNHLPFHLKVCFLYIGANPEDEEISVREWIWLWIAEGLIQQNDGGKSLEAIAKDYLTNLIERNLVTVAKKGSLGIIKACRIHDLLRQLCLKKAVEEKFLEQIYGKESSSPFATNEHRRLFIDAPFFNKFSSTPCARNLRSLLCSSLPNNKAIVAEENLSFSIEKLGQLRGGDLVLLRCLAISLTSGHHHLAPKILCYLWNLEILYIKAKSKWGNILLPHDIFKMIKLRHLYSRGGTFTYHHDSHVEEEGNMLDSLESLQWMDICEHCLRFLKRTPNLKKLRLSGDLSTHDDALMLPDLEFLESLEILSLYGKTWGDRVESTWLKLPSTLTKLTLENTLLEWKKLSEILQTLRSLKVLKLLGAACRGRIWDTSELKTDFSQLKYLRLQHLDIKEWSASKVQFQGLEVLVIQHCYRLKEIPFESSNLSELREIKVEYSCLSAEESAREILKELRNNTREDDCPKLFTIGNTPEICSKCRKGWADTDDVEELPCSHTYHTECVKTLSYCPQCGSKIDAGESSLSFRS